MFAGNFAPLGWMFCEGQLLPIADNDALFNLIGTTYGGDGQTTFSLPDLRGRLPIHLGAGFVLSQTGGSETVTLTANQLPAHNHQAEASSANADRQNPKGALLAKPREAAYASLGGPATQMKAAVTSAVGGSQPHTNLQPYLCVNFIISLFGIFPSPT